MSKQNYAKTPITPITAASVSGAVNAMVVDDNEKRAVSHSTSPQRDSALRVGGKQLRTQSPFTTALFNESDALSEVQTFPSIIAATVMSSTISISDDDPTSVAGITNIMKRFFVICRLYDEALCTGLLSVGHMTRHHVQVCCYL